MRRWVWRGGWRALVLGLSAVALAVIGFCKGTAQGIAALAAAGTVGAVVVALFHDWFASVVYPPRLSLEQGAASCPVEHYQGGGVGWGWWYSLRVVNRRPERTARNCRVLLTAMYDVKDEGPPKSRGMTIPCPLWWAVISDSPVEKRMGPEDALVNILHTASIDEKGARVFQEPERQHWDKALLVALVGQTFNFRSNIREGEKVWLVVQISAMHFIPGDPWIFEVDRRGCPGRETPEADAWDAIGFREVRPEEYRRRFETGA